MDNTNRHAKISWVPPLEYMISAESGRCRYKPLNPTSSLVNIQTSNTKWIHQVTHTCAHTRTTTHIIIQKKEDMNLSWGQEWIIYEGLKKTVG